MNNFDILSKDILIELAIELDLPDIIKWCSVNKRFNDATCKSETFWRRKFNHDYGDYPKVPGLSWKEFYRYVTVTSPEDLLWEGAVQQNILSYVVVALKRGADVNRDGILRISSMEGKLDIVKYLVEHGANIHSLNDGLNWASYYGKLEVVKYLLENGADVRFKDDFALRFASNFGYLEVVKYLVEHGANVHANDDQALKQARMNKHFDVADYLESLP